jgi:hypothetical protein
LWFVLKMAVNYCIGISTHIYIDIILILATTRLTQIIVLI